MKKLFICMCVLFLITGCSQTVAETDMPETETAVKEEMSPPAIPAETEEAPGAAVPMEEAPVVSIIESIEELQNVMLAGRTVTCPLYGWQKIRDGELTESGTLPSTFAVRFILPEGWYPEEDTDEVRCMDGDGRCRMTLIPYLRDVYDTPDNPESNWHWDIPMDIHSGGYAHESWEDDGCQVNLHFYHYVKPGSPVSDDFGLIVQFYTYADDPEDYYHTVTRSLFETIMFLPEQLLTAEQPAPSFTPVHITVSDFGDMAPDPEGYFYFVKDDMNEIEYGCGITMDFPDSWQLEYTTASDIPRSEAGIYSTKRMEYYSFLYRTAETDVTTVECTTPAGQMYRYWETPGSTMEGLGVIWHHCEYAVDVNNERFWFHIYFLTFSDDPAGYFEDYIQPMIDSVTISVDQ